jgi:class 3 adenylate cyclase/predicted ATPase
MDIGGWLRSLGLGQYETVFRENAINEKVLPNLTAEDLKDMGVGIVGHRRMLLDAIALLRAAGSAKAPPAEASSTTPKPAQDAAERRQVTVMFSDLVGSTALSARMDPEDLRDVISSYQKCVTEIVRRFGGYVAKYLGDGVLVYFGYPQAHEDDAERSVRAGLELVGAVNALKTRAPLQTRAGIATGLVVVGDLIGSGDAQERGIVGETPNLAARIQGIAEPNMVAIAESTRRLLGGLFDLQDLGAQDLKGIAAPVRAWAALRPASVESRFEALHASSLTDLVGREEELELLQRRWSRAKNGEGQVVLLSGEPGIGKSRLTAALMESLASEPHTRLRYFCSPQHTDSALYPIISQMERAAGLAHDDPLEAKLGKVDRVLAKTSTSKQDAALFADMLSLSNDGRYPTLDLTPEQRRQRTLQGLVSQLEVVAGENPTLMIFEDAHWSDPTSLEVFSRVIDRIVGLRVLLLVTFRPEFAPPWIGQPHVTALTLNRLPKRAIEAMIDGVVNNNRFPASVRQDIIERSDGIPLFVEEMTKAVLEAESEDAARRTAAAVPSSALAVPASLQASLMARLDRLGPVKEIAQAGAAIGREFSHTLLAAVAGKPDGELASALDRLMQSGLLFRRGLPPHATYLFKHALIQDAAYGTLLREPRRALHARITKILETQFAEIARTQPELVARHCTEAGLIEKAAGLWGMAGRRSLERSALVESLKQFTRALDQIASLPTSPALRREQIKYQIGLIQPLGHLRGFAAPETKTAVERANLLIEQAEALGEEPGDPITLFSVLTGAWGAATVAFNGDVSSNLAEQALSIATRHGATRLLVTGHLMVGQSSLYTGKIAEAVTHFDQAFALYDPEQHRSLASAMDHGVEAVGFRSWGRWILGYPDAALVDAKQAIEDAREIGNAGSVMVALACAGATYLLVQNYETANVIFDELSVLASEKTTQYWKAIGAIGKATTLAVTTKSSRAVHMLNSGVAKFRSTGSTLYVPWFSTYLMAGYVALDEFDKARRCAHETMSIIETTKERWCEVEINRIAGEIELKSQEPDPAKAEEYFHHALVVARAQQAKSWELRAAMSMARLWRDQGKRDEARELLAPVYGWFTEGFDTLDLKEAKALLNELAS